MTDVRIDGVKYVPVAEAHVSAEAIRDAIVTQWWGDGWQENAPEASRYLRVIVTDDDSGGDTIDEFIAAILAKLSGSS